MLGCRRICTIQQFHSTAFSRPIGQQLFYLPLSLYPRKILPQVLLEYTPSPFSKRAHSLLAVYKKLFIFTSICIPPLLSSNFVKMSPLCFDAHQAHDSNHRFTRFRLYYQYILFSLYRVLHIIRFFKKYKLFIAQILLNCNNY